MNQQELWDFFKATGDLRIYLKYKELQQASCQEKQEIPSPTGSLLLKEP